MKTHTLFIAIASLMLITGIASAQSSVFTYQGHLMDGGASANGDYDIQFTLKTLLTGGATVGIPQVANPAHAVNGIFTVELNFTSTPFSNGSDRWMELAVRPAGSLDPYTVLTPRQRVTATPYAIRSGSATTAVTATLATTATTATDATNLTGTLTAGNFLDDSIPDTGLSPNVVLANTSNTFTSPQTTQAGGSTVQTLTSSHIFGSWLNLNNTSVGGRSWNLVATGSSDPNGAAAGSLVIRDASAGAVRMGIDTSGNLGIGTTMPTLAKLVVNGQVNNNAGIFGSVQPISLQNAFPVVGFNCYYSGSGGVVNIFTGGGYGGLFGMDPGTGNFFLDTTNTVGGNGAPLVRTRRMDILNNGNVGIGTSGPPDAKLQVNGDVKLGTNGQYFAMASDENLRIVRGGVTSSGGVWFGDGFTVTKNGTGDYTITYAATFFHRPTVVATAYGQSSPQIVTLDSGSVFYAIIKIWNTSGALVDSNFDFIAVGPR